MIDQKFKYFAFISYSGKNEKWAKWLHSKLENYRIPSALCKENPDIPKKIRPVFWYKKDLSGTKLKESLEKELEVSQYLIVICSPDSAKSDWVNDEVKSFITKGRNKYIIPFIIDGIPHSTDENKECFPKSLRDLSREEEIRGINVHTEGKQHALVDVIATMFGVSFDTLWQRHKRRKRNIRNIWIGVCSFIIVCILGIWDYNRPRYEYFANYVDVYGKPTGIVKLTESQREKRNNCYMFEYRRVPIGEPDFYSWRVVKVIAVNSALLPHEIINTEYNTRYPIQEYKYYEKTGNVSQILFYNEKGKLIVKHNLTSRGNKIAAVADIISADEEKGSDFIGADQLSLLYARMDQSRSKAKIVRFVYERDSCGHIIKQTFHSNNDIDLSLSSTMDENGIYGMSFLLDSLGLPVEINCIDKKGNTIESRKGFSKIIYKYDNWANTIYTEYANINNEPVSNELNWAICTNISDTYGNIIEENYFQNKGVRCNSNRGISSIRYEYDSNGYISNERFYDSNGKPVLNYRGIARYGYKNNRKGYVLEATFFDVDDNIKQTIYGFARAENKYDDNGNCIEVSYFDEKGNPCISIEGCAKWTRKFDKDGNLIEHWFWGIDNKLCLLDGYIAGWTADYNEDGSCIEKRTYNTDRELTISDMGYAIVKYSYDDFGNQNGGTYYNKNSEPCKSKEGFARWVASYNINGQKVKESYYDEHGKPCNNVHGYASIEITYNDNGDIVSITKYDETEIH